MTAVAVRTYFKLPRNPFQGALPEALAMCHLVLTRNQSRQVDVLAVERWGFSSLVLMENAGRAAADKLCQINKDSLPVSIFCGKGNNGGDGFVMARHLQLRGVPVQVLIFHEPQDFSADALANFKILEQCQIPCLQLNSPPDPEHWQSALEQACHNSAWLVDALLGTGSSGPPRSPLDTVIQWVNASSAQRLALDLPSGLDCDTAEVEEIAIRADWTFTFAATKPALIRKDATEYVGNVQVCDIGVPRSLLETCATL